MKAKRGKVNNSVKGPLGVKLISAWYFILALLAFFAGVSILFGGVSLLPEELQPFGNLSGVILVLFGLFEMFVAIELLKIKNWARIAAIVLSVLSILSQIFSAWSFNGIFEFVIDILIVWYLFFNSEGKNVFI